MPSSQHEELRKLAVKWLTNRGCTVVLSELVTAAFETPDAIGWKYGNSVLIEVKVSRADLRANMDKPSVRGGRSVGLTRYFMIPDGMVAIEDALLAGPHAEYGVLSVKDGRVKCLREPIEQATDQTCEIRMLTSALRRIKTREFITIIQEDSAIAAKGESGA